MNNKQDGFTLWFTGLPCSGKTAIADALSKKLKIANLKVERLDGDIVRQSLARDLGFSKEDRDKNIERVAFVAKLLSRNGVATLVSFVSPYRDRRQYARENTTNFIEIYVKCPIKICKERDAKGMYQKAIKGDISNFTGVDDPFEEPINPELVLETDMESLEESVEKVFHFITEKGYLKKQKQEIHSKESHHRSVAKAFLWRIFATFLTMVIVYAFTKKVVLSLGVGVVEVITKMLFYYLHERIWANILWGRKN